MTNEPDVEVLFPNTPEGRRKACEREKAGNGNWEEHIDWDQGQEDSVSELVLLGIVIDCIEDSPELFSPKAVDDVFRHSGKKIDRLRYAGSIELVDIIEVYEVNPDRANLPA